jgi:hypothetical protein
VIELSYLFLDACSLSGTVDHTTFVRDRLQHPRIRITNRMSGIAQNDYFARSNVQARMETCCDSANQKV